MIMRKRFGGVVTTADHLLKAKAVGLVDGPELFDRDEHPQWVWGIQFSFDAFTHTPRTKF